ncbi:hypothetical protein H4R21_000843 [Coemansia helicoidea]|uniref:Uncharacterized protein n=1 Tax=Coemansia helicoidea TaxID=1286919 RepID=A0ACC1LEN6_9FUNG|nr:hypothetical protein H4R21_000843 [Coemansia helicoidea]
MANSKDCSIPPVLQPSRSGTRLATFGAGCFWSVELVFQRRAGVLQTQVGYTGGRKGPTTYLEVCGGTTNHAEVVRLEYDPEAVTYSELLTIFWNKHNPTQGNRQGGDLGTQYRSAIFYHDDEQRDLAEASKTERQKRYDAPITTEIVPAGEFLPAEVYHQKYLEKGGQCAAKGCSDSISCYGY